VATERGAMSQWQEREMAVEGVCNEVNG